MSGVVSIGKPPWSRQDMIDKLEEFVSIYERRPIQTNDGGMMAPHMFLAWFTMCALQPKAIIESGIWLGQGTWLFEQACPDAELYCIDPILDRLQYKSSKAKYFDRDFSTIDWGLLPKEKTVCFFDDHQNAYERIKTATWFGFKHLLFEDNYPPSQGDCYSLKKAFMHAGFNFYPPHLKSLKGKTKMAIKTLLGRKPLHWPEILPNEVDEKYLRQNLDVYYEFPPVFKKNETRWGDAWEEKNYPTAAPLLDAVKNKYQQIFLDEAVYYTWMCYVKLK